ncbi:MAG: hypothetical protein D6736_03030 [Nitrospinota bacterium]|nr:MAG: hypothetical protein D6736_03030 [Nitrospinota bacterium]
MASLFLILFLLACGRDAAEDTATEFVNWYYVQIDQKQALPLTVGLATQKLQRELVTLQGVGAEQRRQGKKDLTVRYTLDKSREEEDRRYFFFTLKVELPQGRSIEKKLLITTIQREGKWRVSNYDEYDVPLQ